MKRYRWISLAACVLAGWWTLSGSGAARANSVIDRASLLTAFIDKCTADRSKANADNPAITQMKIDTAGLCVCVAQALATNLSDDQVIAMASGPLSANDEALFTAARNYCIVLMVDAASSP